MFGIVEKRNIAAQKKEASPIEVPKENACDFRAYIIDPDPREALVRYAAGDGVRFNGWLAPEKQCARPVQGCP